MLTAKKNVFALDNFEGPLDFLLHLIQKNEIDIYDVAIHKITDQFLKKIEEMKKCGIEAGAEFISTAAYLLWLKSKTLLPKHEQELHDDEEGVDPKFEIIHYLLDYCRFKQVAKDLGHREYQQTAFYSRGVQESETKRPLGIEHISLQELAFYFQEMIAKSSTTKQPIQDEAWKVSDKINLIRHLIKDQQEIGISVLFSQNRSRLELITTFLAILELMKMGVIHIGKETETGNLLIFSAREPQLTLWPKT